MPNKKQPNREELLKELRFWIDKLSQDHTSSMSIYQTYFKCRLLLQALAIERYQGVFALYAKQGEHPWMPAEGMVEIMKDTTEMMQTITENEGWAFRRPCADEEIRMAVSRAYHPDK